MPEFVPFEKIARLRRDIVITEKIDGTNAAVGVTEDGEVYAQSRTRIITPQADNFGFAAWVAEHEAKFRELLGPGLHFGEWWGKGIQRGYGLDRRRFSLFNTARWYLQLEIGVVPVLYEGPFTQGAIDMALDELRYGGSVAAPGFKPAEGIVIFHKAAGRLFKVTLDNDAVPKSQLALVPPRRCGCRADTELFEASGCAVCGHRDHGRAGCEEPLAGEPVHDDPNLGKSTYHAFRSWQTSGRHG